MSQRVPMAVWFTALLIANVMGIWPGIALAQSHYIFLGPLMGWLFYLHVINLFLKGQFSGDLYLWLTILASLGYLLAVPGYGICTYWAVRSTGNRTKGLQVATIAAFTSALIAIPTTIITRAILDNTSLWYNYLTSASFLLLHGSVLIHLLISAIFGWLISAQLALWHRRNNTSTPVEQ